jgi:hypothetical protein
VTRVRFFCAINSWTGGAPALTHVALARVWSLQLGGWANADVAAPMTSAAIKPKQVAIFGITRAHPYINAQPSRIRPGAVNRLVGGKTSPTTSP